MKYRKVENYKFELAENFSIQTGFLIPESIITPNNRYPFITLSDNGILEIWKGYAIDGVTNAINSTNVIKAAFVHDALYQLMRIGKLPLSYKDKSDKLFYDILIKDGTAKFRAWYMYQAVKLFGEKYAKPTSKKEEQENIIEIL